jgi:Xaa-Pro aminopeptidase
MTEASHGSDPTRFAARRRALAAQVDGPILLVGHGVRARNLPMNALPFRQCSTFWYFTGCAEPDAAVLIDGDHTTLWLPEPAADDALWHGHVTSLDAQRERYGVDAVAPYGDEHLLALADRRPHTLAVADEGKNRLLDRLAARAGAPDRAHRFDQRHHGSPVLARAVIELRRPKDAWEQAELREAGRVSAAAHVLAMRLTRPGVHERALNALFEAYLAAHDLAPGYGTILTQDGEILHNRSHHARLAPGRLLLLDGGGELARSGYGADITRTWPVSGRFDGRQRAAYEACLAAQQAAIALCRPGVRYRAVHDAACRVLAEFLLDAGLLRHATVDEVLERHAHALFFPHGVGHLLGLDVHDLENFGDLPAYPAGQARPAPFGTRYLRLDLPLEADWVVTVEPGFYVVPAILGDPALREQFGDLLHDDEAARWAGFGGIRIEDDVLITAQGPDVLTSAAPSRLDDVEACVGSGALLEAWLP